MIKLYLLLFVFLVQVQFSQAQSNDGWLDPTQSSKPWTRWWWMGNAVDEENISRELKAFSKAGIGGVEITPIYGVKGEEEHFIEYLSPKFSEMIKYTINEADKLGMGVDLPPGSGWRCGGPFVPEEKGLWNLKIKKYAIKAGEKWTVHADEKNVDAISFYADGKTELIKSKSFIAPEDGTVYLALRVKSGNKVKRPSKGGEGWAIDTFNEDITNWYLSDFWKRLDVEGGKLRCFFHDSFEYTGDFTTNFLTEFTTRRGYNLGNYLYVLAGDCDDVDIINRVKSDYRETLADLVLESFIQPMTTWANQHKSLNRNQAHGSPGNILDLYAACDIPETEIFKEVEPGTVDIFVNKFASSAAHITGKKLVSSESFTWLKEHWTVSTTDLVRATNRFFLAGINHMFFHGTCYSPEDAEWPGWLFYASTQLNNRNPLWHELPVLFKYIERTQTILQQSKTNNDVLIYWPYYDVAASEGKIFNHLGVNKDAGWFISHPIFNMSERLMAAGYTFDYISDKQLLNCATVNGKIESSGKAKYKAIVIPKTNYIPLKTIQKLKEFINDGGIVIFDKELPSSVPGMFDLENRKAKLNEVKMALETEKLCGDVLNLLQNAAVFGEKSLTEHGFNYSKLKMNEEDWYLVFNTGLHLKGGWVELNTLADSYILMNPMNGEINRAESKGNKVRLQLESEQSVFIRCKNEDTRAPEFVYYENTDKSVEIGALWKIEFLEGGPVYPGNLQTDNLSSWTELGDSDAQRFAGTVKYTTDFYWSDEIKTAQIDLGVVKDCAHVYLNGNDLGTLLGPTFKLNTNKLVKGTNNLVVEVSNIAANRIRDLDKRGVEWRKFYDINLINIDYKPFDASDWKIHEAGLLGPVTIRYKE